jgi:hypothetical protein
MNALLATLRSTSGILRALLIAGLLAFAATEVAAQSATPLFTAPPGGAAADVRLAAKRATDKPYIARQRAVGIDLRQIQPQAGRNKLALSVDLFDGVALLADPPVLVLDEPTSSLDTAARHQFLNLLVEVGTAGKTIVFTSHRIEEVETLAETVVVMERGVVQTRCAGSELAGVLGLRTQVKLRMEPRWLDMALGVLQAEGFSARRNGVGVLVDVPARQKTLPIHALTRADIPVTDFEME